jgi:hypothetical protein
MYTVVFTEDGDYDFDCAVHSSMTGTVRVGSVDADDSSARAFGFLKCSVLVFLFVVMFHM